MQKRKLGRSGLQVSAIGLGCMRMSPGHGEVGASKAEMITLIRDAVSRGICSGANRTVLKGVPYSLVHCGSK